MLRSRLLLKPRCVRLRRFHQLPAMEKRAAAGQPVPLAEVAEALAPRCTAAAQNPSQAGPADEWLAAGQSALRLVEHSGEPMDARLGWALHTVLLRGGATEESVQLLAKAASTGVLDEREVRSITTSSLKQLLVARSGDAQEVAATAREDGHWDLLRALQDHGLACQRHHTQVLHACESREEVHRVLRGMKLCKIVRTVCPRVHLTSKRTKSHVHADLIWPAGCGRHVLLGTALRADVVGRREAGSCCPCGSIAVWKLDSGRNLCHSNQHAQSFGAAGRFLAC